MSLQIEYRDRVAYVFLNRPEVRNAFNEELIEGLDRAFQKFSTDSTLRAVVLGARGKVFCAGGDLNWMRAAAHQTWEQNQADAQRLANMLWSIYSCRLPVVGRIHGDCYAGGIGLAAVCDVLIAAQEAQFCISEVKLGLMPATIGPYVMRALGEQASRRYCLTAERFDAATALRLGFVHEAVPIDAIDAAVDTVLQTVRSNSPAAVAACKKLIKDLSAQPITAQLRAETAQRIADIRCSEEGKEGVQAFLSKRAPSWQ